MRLAGHCVLVVSNEPWGPVWFSKHFVAAELAVRNDVVFVDPPAPWRPWRLRPPTLELVRAPVCLRVLRYTNYLPFSGRSRLLFVANERLVVRRALALLRAMRLLPTVFWTFDPHRLVDPARFGVGASVYQMVDYYRVRWEADLVKNVTLVTAVSPVVAGRREWGRPIEIIPHAVAPPGIDRERRLRADCAREAVLVGTFTSRVDYRLLLALADAEPHCRIRLVGPLDPSRLDADDRSVVSELRARPNVEFVGTRQALDVPQEVLRARIAICAYKPAAPGNSIDSHKVLQYLALGKRVVSTPLTAYHSAPSSLVTLVDTPAAFVRACRQALDEPQDPRLREERIAFAEEHSYSRMVSRIESLLPEATPPRLE